MNLLYEVRRNYPDLVAQRYKLDAETLALPPYELLEAIGRKRGLLVRGGEVNTNAVPSCWWTSSAPASGAASLWSARPSGMICRILPRRTTNETAF